MKTSVLFRRVHAWSLTLLAVPLLVMCVSGIILHLKKAVAWVQPTEVRGAGGPPAVELSRLLELCRSTPELRVKDWSDIKRVDFRPNTGVIKVLTTNAAEAQIDASSGRMLAVAVRRSDLIEGIHDGSWFHPLVKTWIFLPTGVVVTAGILSGVYLFFLPLVSKQRAVSRKVGQRSAAREVVAAPGIEGTAPDGRDLAAHVLRP